MRRTPVKLPSFPRKKAEKSTRQKGEVRRWERLIPWFFLAPSLLVVAVIVLLPFLDVLRRSFTSAMSHQFVGLQNYRIVLANEAFQLAAANTAKFIAVCLPLLLVLSLIIALMLSAVKETRGIFKTSFLIPMAIPVASIVFLWRAMFHDKGILNAVLLQTGQEPISWIGSSAAFWVLVFTYLWKNAGYDMVLWVSGLSGISPAFYESAEIDGAGAWSRFWKITLPNLLPTMFTVLVLSLLNSFKVFREAYLIAGSYPHDSIYMLQHLFNNWFLNLDVDKMCAGAVLMALVVFLLIMLLQKIWSREGDL